MELLREDSCSFDPAGAISVGRSFQVYNGSLLACHNSLKWD